MDRRRRAIALSTAGVALLVGTLLIGALTAPSLGQRADGQRRTLVGSQSTHGGWAEGGSVFLLANDTVEWRANETDSYFDVTMLDNGSVLAGFMQSGYTEGCGPYTPPCAKTGFRVIDPHAPGGPRVTNEYSFPVRNPVNSETHDVEQLDDGEYLLTDMEHERIFTERNGEITWQWNASSFYTPPPDPTRRDWLHINDVDAINATHYLVSVRNANQILLVERGSGVVEVINADDGGSDASCTRHDRQLVPDASGDVRCGDPSVINHQHNPQWLDSGAVLVADSDNDRIVELHRNDAGDWEPAWSVNRVNGVALNWPRDADRLDNGNTLLTDTLNSRVVEVAPNGSTVWSAQVFNLPYEAERLPEGERVGGPRYTHNGTIVAPSQSVPILSMLLFGLKGAFPVIPFWFDELHLGLSLVGVALILGGGVEAAIARFGSPVAALRRRLGGPPGDD